MKNESNFPLGGAINLHTNHFCWEKKNHFESILLHSQSFYKIFTEALNMCVGEGKICSMYLVGGGEG